MANVFTKSLDVNNHPKRNVFDLSFQNNLTMNFGGLYPCFLKEGVPGTSFEIKPTFALNFMPMLFPVQTRMRAHMHFFKVRKRNLWEDYMDFYAKTPRKTFDMPYVDTRIGAFFNNHVKTGSLGDYLGIPSTVTSSVNPVTVNANLNAPYLSGGVGIFWNSDNNLNMSDPYDIYKWYSYKNVGIYSSDAFRANGFQNNSVGTVVDNKGPRFAFLSDYTESTYGQYAYALSRVWARPTGINIDYNTHRIYCTTKFQLSGINATKADSIVKRYQDTVVYSLLAYDHGYKADGYVWAPWKGDCNCAVTYNIANNNCTFSVSFDLDLNKYPELGNTSLPFFYVSECWSNRSIRNSASPLVPYSALTNMSFNYPMTYRSETTDVKDATYLDVPYYMSANQDPNLKVEPIKLNALPFRAYESIYNAFYRNILNNPFMIDGVPEYNKYIPTTKGGLDPNVYQLRYRNWEPDFLTTALQNPQQGENPVLVGITTLPSGSVLTLSDDSGQSLSFIPTLNEDGTGISAVDVIDTPVGAAYTAPRSIVDLASTGISIPDLRNANALQRWLELNARKGLRFKDVVKGHFDVDIRFDELNMPEFLGGVSRDVSVNQVNQTVEGSSASGGEFADQLGSYAGQAYIRGDGNKIRVYCDEPCYIIGIISVVPTPNYSQLLPKLFLKRDVLDEYFPEFSHISMQPITYREVCPIETFNDNVRGTGLDETFGYQRAWYDLISSTDEVHGLFRTQLRNFLINRVFGHKPRLTPGFLTVNPQETNDVFSVTTVDDKILGQIYFDCKAIHPIPKYGIPRLEV